LKSIPCTSVTANMLHYNAKTFADLSSSPALLLLNSILLSVAYLPLFTSIVHKLSPIRFSFITAFHQLSLPTFPLLLFPLLHFQRPHRWRHQSTALDHFPVQAPNGKKSAISNSFRDIWPEILWIHDVITDITLPGSTIHVHHFTHYAVDDYVKRWSNSVRNCRRNSTLKVVMPRLWRHRVTWRHRWRHHSTALRHFPIGSQ